MENIHPFGRSWQTDRIRSGLSSYLLGTSEPTSTSGACRKKSSGRQNSLNSYTIYPLIYRSRRHDRLLFNLNNIPGILEQAYVYIIKMLRILIGNSSGLFRKERNTPLLISLLGKDRTRYHSLTTGSIGCRQGSDNGRLHAVCRIYKRKYDAIVRAHRICPSHHSTERISGSCFQTIDTDYQGMDNYLKNPIGSRYPQIENAVYRINGQLATSSANDLSAIAGFSFISSTFAPDNHSTEHMEKTMYISPAALCCNRNLVCTRNRKKRERAAQ